MLRVRFPLLVALVLGSGSVLLIVGSVSLWRAWQDAAERLRLDARRATAATAMALRAALADLRALELAEAEQRFQVVDGQLVMSESLEQKRRHATRAQLSPAVQPLLHGDFGQALEFDAELESRLAAADELVGVDHQWIALRLAWRAQRAGREPQRDRLLHELAAAEPAPAHDIAASFVLLAATAGQAQVIRAQHITICAAADPELSGAVVARLRELDATMVADRLEAESVRLAAEQRTFDVVAARLGNFVGTEHAAVVQIGEQLVLWHPDRASPSNGRGALVDAWQIVGAIRAADLLAPLPWAGDLVADGERADSGVPRPDETVVPGVLGLAVEPFDAAAGGVSLALLGSLIAIAICFGVGLFAMQRTIRAQDRANRVHAEFLQSVTHELKTPLASIRLLAERLESGRVSEARSRDYYALLADEAERLSVMIDNVLDLGRIERGERAFDRRDHDCDRIIADTVELFRPLAQRDGMQLVATGQCRVRLDIDRGAIVQALLNVLENARKYARDGARIEVRVASVEHAGAASEVVIDVRDFGPGVPDADRERVFERFHRGTHQHDARVAGLGIGLHIARCIVRAHGGELECTAPEPADGGGANFRFRLPAVRVADGDRAAIEVAS